MVWMGAESSSVADQGRAAGSPVREGENDAENLATCCRAPRVWPWWRLQPRPSTRRSARAPPRPRVCTSRAPSLRTLAARSPLSKRDRRHRSTLTFGSPSTQVGHSLSPRVAADTSTATGTARPGHHRCLTAVSRRPTRSCGLRRALPLAPRLVHLRGPVPRWRHLPAPDPPCRSPRCPCPRCPRCPCPQGPRDRARSRWPCRHRHQPLRAQDEGDKPSPWSRSSRCSRCSRCSPAW
jgi:hypothetical protein